MSFLESLPKPFFILAPMDDVTDTVFRQIIATLPYPSHLDGLQGAAEQRSKSYREYDERAAEAATQQSAKSSSSRVTSSASKQAGAVRRYGPDLYFTEFVNVDGLQSPGRPRLMHKLQFSNKERPIIAQLWGLNPDNYYKTTKELIKMGYDGVDINMGCPVKTVVKNGACAALINNRELAGEIIDAVKEAAGDDFPVSIKTRLGFNQVDLSWPEFLLTKNLNMLSIHGRTAKQMSKVNADWELINKVKQMRDSIAQNTLIVGNGDVKNRRHGEGLAEKYGLDGIMIGRGIFDDPFAFAQNSPWQNYTREQKIALYRKHVELFTETWKNNERKIETLNKFCKVYINGFDGAKELRDKLMHSKNAAELLGLLDLSRGSF
jgi:tRNA-dihydrouridine synthase